MTSQKDIQSLIADIDSILPKVDAHLSWPKPGDVAKKRQVLERVRSYLVSQQQDFIAAPEQPPPANSASTEMAQQIAQAVTQEINSLRADFLQPLQADVEALRYEREALVREIRQLEGTRQQLDSFAQKKIVQQQVVSELSQELISQCAENLTQQLAQIFANLEARWMSAESAAGAITSAIPNRGHVGGGVQPQDRLEQVRHVQLQSDQMLAALDANQRVIFEALQRNLQSYQESLSQGLEKMHRLGVQGEMLFTAFVNSLIQQLGQDASTVFASSGQLSDVVNTALMPQSNSLPEAQIALQPLQPLELLHTELENATGSAETQGTIDYATAVPLTSPNMNDAALAELGIVTPEASAEDSFHETLDSEDWEIIEGLDFGDLEVEANDTDELDTFIQLNIEDAASLPSLDAPDTVAKLQLSSDSRSQEIDELYQSLFGTDSLSAPPQSDESQVLTPEFPATFPSFTQLDTSQSQQAAIGFQLPKDYQSFRTDLVNPLSSEVEDVLFEGLADPATERSLSQPPDGSAENWAESWQELFSDDLMADSLSEADWAGEAQASSLAASELESLETIAVLTDLLEEMDLSHDSPSADNSMSVTTNPQIDYQSSESESRSHLGEENYIPASPEEDLLVTDRLETPLDREIRLEQRTLQQLQQDLNSFEASEGQKLPTQPERLSLSSDFESPKIAPDVAQGHQQNPWYPMSEELLAEDWEEGTLNAFSTQEPHQLDTDVKDVAAAPIENKISDNSTRVIPESVESDFEPELFPSEVLELDQENRLSLNTTAPEELATSGEAIALEDETFIEQWDEPVNGTTEEMIASPELVLDWDSSSQAMIDLEQEGEVNAARSGEPLAPHEKASNEKVQDESIHSSQDTTLPSQALDNQSDVSLEAAQHSEQHNAARNSALTPEELVDTNREAFNPEQSDNEQKSNRDSQSDANR
ncbi:MAG TPA: hypothetical protein V6D14_27955 [Coleofasciculaceae cyanobacterium]